MGARLKHRAEDNLVGGPPGGRACKRLGEPSMPSVAIERSHGPSAGDQRPRRKTPYRGLLLSRADWPSLDKKHPLQPTIPELFAEDTERAIGDQYQQHDDVGG